MWRSAFGAIDALKADRTAHRFRVGKKNQAFTVFKSFPAAQEQNPACPNWSKPKWKVQERKEQKTKLPRACRQPKNHTWRFSLRSSFWNFVGLGFYPGLRA